MHPWWSGAARGRFLFPNSVGMQSSQLVFPFSPLPNGFFTISIVYPRPSPLPHLPAPLAQFPVSIWSQDGRRGARTRWRPRTSPWKRFIYVVGGILFCLWLLYLGFNITVKYDYLFVITVHKLFVYVRFIGWESNFTFSIWNINISVLSYIYICIFNSWYWKLSDKSPNVKA